MHYPGGRTPYSSVPSATADSRLIEGWALTEAARRMHVAQTAPVDPAAVRVAVTLNLRLWTIFQASLLEPECALPRKLRLNLLALSHFIDKRTARVMACPATESLDALISINRGIAKGLLTFAFQPADPPPLSPRVHGPRATPTPQTRRSPPQYGGTA